MDKIIYMAGFFDGEGYIGIVKQSKGSKIRRNGKNPYYTLVISISLTNKKVLDLFAKHFGGTISLRFTQRGNHQTSWIWRIWTSKAYNCLEFLYPYLIIKKKQAKLAFSFYKMKCKSEIIRLKTTGRFSFTPEKVLELREKQYLLMKKLKRDF